MKRFTSIAAAVFTAAFLAAATNASAQDSNVDQRTFLTFSGPVQMPGVTLPAGKYVFKLAPTALHNVMQVFDGEEKNIIGQWFFVPVERTSEEQSHADGKPVVMFREMPEGITPAVHYFFYPTDTRGKEFIYPKDQAVKIAAATHETVLATDTEVAKGGEAHVFRVDPNGTEAQYDQNATAKENTNASSDAAASASATSQPSAPESQPSSTASLNSQSDLNNSPASGPPAPVANDRPSNSDNQVAGTSGSYSQSQTTAASPNQSTAAPAQDNPAPRQQAASELPKTASPFMLIGFLGLVSLAGAFGLRLARSTY